MTTWHWIRHGPTHAKSMVGWRNLPADLSDQSQIDRLRAHLPSGAVVVSSDLDRARTTANVLCRAGDTRRADDPHFREIHFGTWDGMSFKDVAARDPILSRRFWEEPGDICAPNGESWNMASARVAAAVRSMTARHKGRHIIAVAHFGVILTQVQRALNLSAHDTLSHKIDNFSVTRIELSEDGASVPLINHLP